MSELIHINLIEDGDYYQVTVNYSSLPIHNHKSRILIKDFVLFLKGYLLSIIALDSTRYEEFKDILISSDSDFLKKLNSKTLISISKQISLFEAVNPIKVNKPIDNNQLKKIMREYDDITKPYYPSPFINIPTVYPGQKYPYKPMEIYCSVGK